VIVHEAQSTLQPCSPVLNPDSHRHPSKAVNPVTLLAGMQSGDQSRAGEGVLFLKRVPGVVAWFPLFFLKREVSVAGFGQDVVPTRGYNERLTTSYDPQVAFCVARSSCTAGSLGSLYYRYL
jgi:hypothetical protein